ncbi:hypothetical protein KBZ21_47560, partial [Streptomyces sp. A73]|nr:hypothetical protein [Streptomyces sp. A73]
YTASGKKRYESASGPGPGERFRDENEAYEYGLDRESDVRNLRPVSRHSGRIATKPWSLTWLSTLDLDPTSINHYR